MKPGDMWVPAGSRGKMGDAHQIWVKVIETEASVTLYSWIRWLVLFFPWTTAAFWKWWCANELIKRYFWPHGPTKENQFCFFVKINESKWTNHWYHVTNGGSLVTREETVVVITNVSKSPWQRTHSRLTAAVAVVSGQQLFYCSCFRAGCCSS